MIIEEECQKLDFWQRKERWIDREEDCRCRGFLLKV